MKISFVIPKWFKNDTVLIVVGYVFWRFALLILSYWSLRILGIAPFEGSGMKPFNFDHALFGLGRLVDSQSNWDGWHYVSISQQGFTYPYQYAFFPLLPVLINAVTFLTHLHPLVAGLLVTNVSFILAIILLYKLVLRQYDKQTAALTVFLLLIFPSSFFGGMIYTESLFLLLSILCFYFFQSRKFFLLACSGFLLALTRNLGVLMVIPLLYAYFKEYLGSWNIRKIRWNIIAVFAPVAGLFSWMVCLYRITGDPLNFFHAQKLFFRETSIHLLRNFYMNLSNTWHNFSVPTNLFEIVLVVLTILVLVVAFVKKQNLTYILWGTLLLLPPLTQNMYASNNRYMFVIFPVYIFLARFFKNKFYLFGIYGFFSVVALCISVVLFSTFRWAG